jgi:hypothetical protein
MLLKNAAAPQQLDAALADWRQEEKMALELL